MSGIFYLLGLRFPPPVVGDSGAEIEPNVNAYEVVDESKEPSEKPFMSKIISIQCGVGHETHGQSASKAAVKACRQAIEFTSMPQLSDLVPKEFDEVRLSVTLAVPPAYKDNIDLRMVRKVFPHGKLQFNIQDGGMLTPSGVMIEDLGDTCDEMIMVCAAVTIGY